MSIRMQIAVVMAAFTLTSGMAYAKSSPILSRTELKKLIRSAHSAEDYASLASYFEWRQQAFLQQARAELAQWDNRDLFASGFAAKYPRPIDASRNRYEYFRIQARQMSQKAAYYESLSEEASR